MSKLCLVCGKRAYSDYCLAHKPHKPLPRPTIAISRYGQRAQTYTVWRNTVAIPYLDKKYGHRCSCCGTDKNLDVDHIKGRGTNPELKYALSNLAYRCRTCHRNKTDGVPCYHTNK